MALNKNTEDTLKDIADAISASNEVIDMLRQHYEAQLRDLRTFLWCAVKEQGGEVKISKHTLCAIDLGNSMLEVYHDVKNDCLTVVAREKK